MLSLARSLRDFQRGRSSEAALLEQLEAILADGRSSPRGLLDTLESQHRKEPLPEALHDSIRTRLEHAAAALGGEEAYDATQVATSVPGDALPGDTIPPTVPLDTTDISGESGAQADHLPGPGDTTTACGFRSRSSAGLATSLRTTSTAASLISESP